MKYWIFRIFVVVGVIAIICFWTLGYYYAGKNDAGYECMIEKGKILSEMKSYVLMTEEQLSLCYNYASTLENELERLNETNETEPLHIECEGRDE